MSESKVILVTGANSGIGFELVRLLAEKAHTVYLGARNEVAGKEAVEKLHADGLKTVKFALIDVTKVSTIEATKAAIESAEGRLNVLVNNAGISKLGVNQNATSIDLETIRDAMETNFYGLIQTTITLLPLLRKSKNGVILNVTTDMASNSYQARPEAEARLNVVAYNTSKAAMNSYSIALAQELKNEGIKVNVVTPGFTTTKLNHHAPGGKTMKEGAESLVPWALLDNNGPTGKFFDWDGNEFPW